MAEFNYALASDSWDQEEELAIRRVLTSKRFTMGSEVRAFESLIESKFDVKHAVMVNSGSSANLVMLTAMQIRFGSNWPEKPEVIVPAVSWSTTFTPFYYLNMKPVFVDVDPENFGLSAKAVKNAITPNTVGILAVNVLGQPADLDYLREISGEHDLFLVEDNCESLGATLGGKLTGSFGFAASHSSFFSHHISTMEGGWVTTDDDELYEICLALRAHGWIREQPPESSLRRDAVAGFSSLFHFVLPGLNFRPIELEAAIGVEQLKKLDTMNAWRVKNETKFKELFGQSKNVLLQGGRGKSTSFALPLILTGKLEGKRSELAALFSKHGIECRPIIAGNFTRQPVMKYLDSPEIGPLPVSDLIHEEGLYLGNHPRDLSLELDGAWRLFQQFEKAETEKAF